MAKLKICVVVHISLKCRQKKITDRKDPYRGDSLSLPFMNLPSQLQPALLPHFRRGKIQNNRISVVFHTVGLHALTLWTEISCRVTRICQQILQNDLFFAGSINESQLQLLEIRSESALEHFPDSIQITMTGNKCLFTCKNIQ